MASRFTKAFQFISLLLAFAVAHVYVMAGPARLGNDPRTTDPSAGRPAAETVAPTSAASETAASEGQQRAEVASERMPLTAGTRSALNRIFSRKDMEARATVAGNTFLNARTSAASTFKASLKNSATAQPADDDSDSGGGGSKGAWIAVGVIAAVLTIAIIGLRHDRHAEVQ